MEELSIKKDTYYADIKFLGIKPDKDSEGKIWLTFEQAEQVKALRQHVENTGRREGFEISSIVKVDNNKLATSANSNSDQDIYIQPSEPTAQFDFNQLMRSAAELKAREIAMPALVKRAIADKMSEEDLPEDLQEKVNLAREAANPKFTPVQVADVLLSQWRNQGGN
ncbi:hypothetical protein FACHB389_36420 [Nostoc calcicola FACHB-389]|nr:hypothetical protein FACHB389_36420 [Nostoc calcicola FACHB-389]